MIITEVTNLKKVSKNKRKGYNDEFKKLKKGDRSEETIHDCRVAARRLNAMLEVMDIIKNFTVNINSLQNTIKKSRKELGTARDIQVTRSFLYKNQKDLEFLDFNSFEQYYQQFKKKSLKETNKFIKSFKLKKVNKKLKKVFKDYFKNINEKTSLDNLFKEINKEKETVLTSFYHLDRNDISTFHQLRKDLKKLRYKLEIINEISLESYNISNYKDIQDLLGEIQDIAVIKEILKSKFQLSDSDNNIEKLNYFLNSEQDKLINKFLNKNELFLEMMIKL